MRRRSRHAGSLALVVVLLAGACSPSPEESDQQSGAPMAIADVPSEAGRSPSNQTLRVAVDTPTTLVPGEATSRSELVLVDALFDALTAWTPSGEVVPRAAVRWEGSADGTEWTFRLREGATFHDGSPVTADDVKFGWEYAVASGASGYHLRDVVGYEAVRSGEAGRLAGVSASSERTLVVRLSRPQAEFPSIVAHPSLAPLPASAWSEGPDDFRAQPVGNGPFAMAEPWAAAADQSAFVRVARFPDWRNAPTPGQVGTDPEPVELDEVVFRFMDPETAYLAFQQERVDLASVPDEALDTAVERYGEAGDGYTGPGVLLGDVPSLYALGFNLAVEPFDDPQVRRAVSLAVNRPALVDGQPAGNASVARAAVPGGVPGARPAPCRDCAHRPSLAEDIFAERRVRSLVLWTTPGQGHEHVAERLRADLADVGVRLDVRILDFENYLSALRDGRAGLFRLGWSLDHPSMANILEPLFHSAAIGAEDLDGGFNVGRYAAEDVDGLLDQARVTPDPEERLALHQQAEDVILNRDQAIAPLLTLGHQMVVAERVDGLTVTPMGLLTLEEVQVREAGG